MHVKLTRRWGPHRGGKSVEVSDSQGAWLIQHNYAESAGDIQAPVQPAAAPGGNGEDPLAGGDGTRLRPRVPRSQGSIASSAPGSSPTYRAGFDKEASERQGMAGRNYEPPAEGDKSAQDAKKPARRRSKSES